MNSNATAASHLHRAVQVVALQLLVCGPLWGAEEQEDTYLTREQLKEYQFEQQPEQMEIEVNGLSVGQRFIMASQRRNLSELIYRQLGVAKLTDEDVRSALRTAYPDGHQGVESAELLRTVFGAIHLGRGAASDGCD